MLKKRSWNQFTIEGIVIVVSILLAFSIEAWWQNRQDLAEERALLLGMQEDLVENQQRVLELIDSLEYRADILNAFIDLTYAEFQENNGAPIYRELVSTLYRSYTTDGVTGGYLQATINSGMLAQISSPQIRSELSAIDARLENLDLLADDIRSLTDQLLIEMGKIPEVLRPYRLTPGRAGDTVSPEIYNQLKSNYLLIALSHAKLNRLDAYQNNFEGMHGSLEFLNNILNEELNRK